MSELTHQRLLEVLSFDPETGVFVWRKRYARRESGDMAGTIHNRTGRLQICIDQRSYFAHRLAWFYVHGEWPKQEIDHINGNKADNRIANLRDVSRAINQQNIRKPHKNKTGYLLGAYLEKNRSSRPWRASIKLDGKSRYLGFFDTQEEAHAVYLEAKRKLHAGCTI